MTGQFRVAEESRPVSHIRVAEVSRPVGHIRVAEESRPVGHMQYNTRLCIQLSSSENG